MVTGEWTGTMNLTEPQAGSDVGALHAPGPSPDGDGTWRITGQKIFITYGEHDMTDNIVHLVLARVPDAPPGTKGISCFIVPKLLVNDDGSLGERNDVRCIAIEHKMGIHAQPDVHARVRRRRRLPHRRAEQGHALHVHDDEQRPAVGRAVRAWRSASARTSRRSTTPTSAGRAAPSARPPGETSPIIEHADVRRMLLTMRALVEAMRGLRLRERRGGRPARATMTDEAIRERAQELVELLTPITKAWCTDMGTEVASLAMQVHGGMGYIEETGVAQHYRDIRIAAIYEGTNGIQAMDLVGRKLPMRGGGVVDGIPRSRARGSSIPSFGRCSGRSRLSAALREATTWILTHGADDPNDALAAATPYLRMFGIVVGGWVMARQAIAARRLGDSTTSSRRLASTSRATATGGRTCSAAVTAGKDVLFALSPEELDSRR